LAKTISLGSSKIDQRKYLTLSTKSLTKPKGMKKTSLQYEFEPLGNSPEDGYNDPLKTIFGQAAETVTREAFQNSIDAAVDKKKPVRVRVSLKFLKSSDIPRVEQLDKVLEACAANKNGRKHFENARKVLKSQKIPTLVISDFNTTGLTGENHDKQGKYYNFFKSVGGHNKPVGSAGSYGYGKSTNIAFSEIDTFFATSNHGGKQSEMLFMGCVRVCSHTINRTEKRGVGSFGMPGQLPVRDVAHIPQSFLLEHRLTSRGTDIFIPAYKDHQSWKANTIKSALKNFWLAILLDKLIVDVEDVHISSSSLDQIIYEYFPKADRVTNSWRRDDPVPYFEAWTKGTKQRTKLKTLGNVEARFLAGDQENATGYVACFRKNLMLIQHKNFRSIVPFTGVFVCDDEKGNAILQKMEPPQHERWDPRVLHAQDENGKPLPECSDADAEYRSFLKDEIKKLLGMRLSKRIELSSVDEFISLKDVKKPVAGDKTGIDKKDKAKEPTGRQTVLPATHSIKPSRTPTPLTALAAASDDGETIVIGTGGGDAPGGNGPSGGKSNNTGKNKLKTTKVDENEGKKTARIAKSSTRAFPETENGQLKTQVIIRTTPPRANKLFNIHFKAGTDEKSLPLPVASVGPQGTISADGNVSDVTSDGNGEIRLAVVFVENQPYALKVNLYEHS
jgi:hypothetical protein